MSGLEMVLALLCILVVLLCLFLAGMSDNNSNQIDKLLKHLEIDPNSQILKDARLDELERRIDNLPQNKHKNVQKELEKVQKMIEGLEE